MKKMVLAMVLVLCTVLVTACGVIEHPSYIYSEAEPHGYYGFTEIDGDALETVQYANIQDQTAWYSDKKVTLKKLKLVNEESLQLYCVSAFYYGDEDYLQSIIDTAKTECGYRNVEICKDNVFRDDSSYRYFLAYMDETEVQQIGDAAQVSVTPVLSNGFYYSKDDGKWYLQAYLAELHGWSYND